MKISDVCFSVCHVTSHGSCYFVLSNESQFFLRPWSVVRCPLCMVHYPLCNVRDRLPVVVGPFLSAPSAFCSVVRSVVHCMVRSVNGGPPVAHFSDLLSSSRFMVCSIVCGPFGETWSAPWRPIGHV